MDSRSFVIVQRPTGLLKVYVQRNAPGHTSDWRGCNYRLYPVYGQPLRGFEDAGAVIAFLHGIARKRQVADSDGKGTFFGDSFRLRWSSITVDIDRHGEVTHRFGIDGIGLTLPHLYCSSR